MKAPFHSFLAIFFLSNVAFSSPVNTPFSRAVGNNTIYGKGTQGTGSLTETHYNGYDSFSGEITPYNNSISTTTKHGQTYMLPTQSGQPIIIGGTGTGSSLDSYNYQGNYIDFYTTSQSGPISASGYTGTGTTSTLYWKPANSSTYSEVGTSITPDSGQAYSGYTYYYWDGQSTPSGAYVNRVDLPAFSP